MYGENMVVDAVAAIVICYWPALTKLKEGNGWVPILMTNVAANVISIYDILPM
jgi:hypothetical protein